MKLETGVLLLFCAILLVSLAAGLPLVGALLAGLALLLTYGRMQKLTWRQLGGMAASGVWRARKILTIFLLIGTLSALWRASGTIASLVVYCGSLVRPSVFLLMAFVLCGLVSFLTGTSFGTAATMGVICMAMGTALGVPAAATGGAILSGAFFGDRCSPVSSSALLTADVTGTDIYRNVRLMMRSAAVPLALACLIFLGAGLLMPHEGELPDLSGLFGAGFVIAPAALIPAALILVLSVAHVDVRIALAAGAAAALPVCVWMQHRGMGELAGFILHGYQAEDAAIAAVLDGGGILSMVKVAAIVCISSAYSGIFQQTKLLDGLRRGIERTAKRTSPFAAMLLTATAGAAISCNQTLTIMLCNQLCEQVEPDAQRRAIAIENTAVVVAPLIPWSIAGSVPLATIGAPMTSLWWAVYLILVPAWGLARDLRRAGKRGKSGE